MLYKQVLLQLLMYTICLKINFSTVFSASTIISYEPQTSPLFRVLCNPVWPQTNSEAIAVSINALSFEVV